MKLKGGYVVVNILGMLTIFVLLCVVVYVFMNVYTRHGEAIRVPEVKGMTIDDATLKLENLGLEIVIADSVFNKKLPTGQVVEQSPKHGMLVKSGHIIYLTINSGKSATLQIPDLIDNSSYREAEAELIALGFKIHKVIEVNGEKDWLYGILCNGKNVYTGDYISIDSKIELQVGNGNFNQKSGDVQIEDAMEESEEDEFEVVE